MSSKAKILIKAASIFEAMTPSQRKGLRFGLFPSALTGPEALAKDGFDTQQDVNAIADALIELSSTTKLSPDDAFVANAPQSVEEGVYLPLLREVARLRRILAIKPEVTQGTYREERDWDTTMETIDKMIALADGVPYVKPVI